MKSAGREVSVASATDPQEKRQGMTEHASEHAKNTVLVVEDEEIVRDLLVTVLTAEGYEVEAVDSGEKALKALESELYDVVLLDLNLPGMYGMNVLAAAPALQTDAAFIVMTAFGTVDTAVEAMKLGAFDYINKPFRPEDAGLRWGPFRRAGRRRRSKGSRCTSLWQSPEPWQCFRPWHRHRP